jgi:hypothetical protein
MRQFICGEDVAVISVLVETARCVDYDSRLAAALGMVLVLEI